MQSKPVIRSQLRSRRRALSGGYRRLADRKIQKHALSLVRRCGARRVACYLDADGEVGTRQLIRALHEEGVQVYLPVVVPGSRRLHFRRCRPDGPLRRNRYGLAEPPPNSGPVVAATSLSLVLAPLVGFDPLGRRLGMGGGYYDTTFSFLHGRHWHPVRVVGLAYTCQQVASLPGAAWDVPLRAVITERGIVLFRRRTSGRWREWV